MSTACRTWATPLRRSCGVLVRTSLPLFAEVALFGCSHNLRHSGASPAPSAMNPESALGRLRARSAMHGQELRDSALRAAPEWRQRSYFSTRKCLALRAINFSPTRSGSSLNRHLIVRFTRPGTYTIAPRSTASRPSRTTRSASIHIQPGIFETFSRAPVTSWNSEYVKPGHSAHTFTPCERFSSPSDCENEIRYDLAAAYSVWPGVPGTRPARDATLTMRP